MRRKWIDFGTCHRHRCCRVSSGGWFEFLRYFYVIRRDLLGITGSPAMLHGFNIDFCTPSIHTLCIRLIATTSSQPCEVTTHMAVILFNSKGNIKVK